jgi:phosphinothricin acetyltransferase
LLPRAAACGFRQMFAVIGDSENVGSIGLHLSVGFRQVAVLKSVGFKFGRWIDSVTMQIAIGEGDRTLPPA